GSRLLNFSEIEPLAGHGMYAGRPQPPRSLVFSPATSRSVLTWAAPSDARGVAAYRVYEGNEKNLIGEIPVSTQRQFAINLPATEPTALYVSAVSALKRESAKIQILVNVPGGAPASPVLPKEFPSEPRGGRREPLPATMR